LQLAYEKAQAPARFQHYDSLYRSFKGDLQSREFKKILMWRPYYETLSESHRKVKTRLPDMYVDSIHEFDGPARKVQLISKGPGHTESDLILYLPEDEVVFAGDLIFNRSHPYLGDGNIPRWKDWLEFLDSLRIKTLMPGHGEIGTAELIVEMKKYLKNIELSAKGMANTMLSSQDSLDIQIPDEYKDWWFDRFYEYNLRFALESLEMEESN
jgi:glyoxylase-like metal-dependent hydrolase (beta-lactamase superfamily II)